MKIAFLFYEGMTALDVVGPHEILSRLPGATSYRVAKRPGAIKTDSQLTLNADYALSDISSADLLVVPGAGSATTLRESPEILGWIRSIHATTTFTTSVCTGSLILGAAGILTQLRATSHWAAIDRLIAFGAVPTYERVVEDSKVITAAGVSAGIDLSLILAAKIAGPQFAQSLQLAIEYDPEPPFDIHKVSPRIRDALQVRMVSKFESPM